MTFALVSWRVVRAFIACTIAYFAFLGLLAVPFLQRHVIYLHGVILTWFQDVNVPEQWGFMRNQVTPFELETSDNITLHAWHILPLGLYRRNEETLIAEPTGLAAEVTSTHAFTLLRDDPNPLLIIYLHGAAGTLASIYRPPSYRALSTGAPDNIHVVAIDYRGFGTSTGTPSEDGLLIDALTLVDWAMNVANIPASRIVIFSQSIGTAVSTSLVQHLAAQSPPVFFAGMVLVAPFADVETLTSTYRVAGMIPILSPIAYFPRLLAFFNSFIVSKWASKDKLARFVRTCEEAGKDVDAYYKIIIIHAQDDYDIPWSHSETLFWHSVNASTSSGISYDKLEQKKLAGRKSLRATGWTFEHRTDRGVIVEKILTYGLHDRIMAYPIVSLAVLEASQ